MALHKAGRPAKPDPSKRQQLHISLYTEDLERLDQLTDNRSEFIRDCIAKAWEEKWGSQVTVSLTLSKPLARELIKAVEQLEPRRPTISFRSPVGRQEALSIFAERETAET